MSSVSVRGLGMVVLVVALLSVVGVGTAVADHDAPDYTDEANHTVSLPHTSDHYPGDHNRENASQQYWLAGEDAFAAEGAEDGIWLDSLSLEAEWIDYSACDETNVATFGVDEGNNNTGTQVDYEFSNYQKEFDHGEVTVEFSGFEDFSGDPPRLGPEDAIVGDYGANSVGGGCLTMTNEPGWYRVRGIITGTEADNGRDPPSEDAEEVRISAFSGFVYICECEDEEEAREELGPPTSPSTPTPAPTATPTPTPTATSTPTPTPTATPTVTPTPEPTPTIRPVTETPTSSSTPSPTATTTTVNATVAGTSSAGIDPVLVVVLSIVVLAGGGLLLQELAI